jgi:hypothetical protein
MYQAYLTYPQIDEVAFTNTDWKAIYGDIKEAVPIDAPIPLGKERLYERLDISFHVFLGFGHNIVSKIALN